MSELTGQTVPVAIYFKSNLNLSSNISQILNSRHEGDSFSSKPSGKKNALYLSVNVFSTKALIGDTIFTSPTSDATAILRVQPSPGFIQKIATIFEGFFKDFSRTTFDFQGPPTWNVISHIVKKCTFSVHSPSIRLELFPFQLLYIFQFTCLKLIVNSCIKQTMLYVGSCLRKLL